MTSLYLIKVQNLPWKRNCTILALYNTMH